MRKFRFYYNGMFMYLMHETEVYNKFQHVIDDVEIGRLLNGHPQRDFDGDTYTLIECNCE